MGLELSFPRPAASPLTESPRAPSRPGSSRAQAWAFLRLLEPRNGPPHLAWYPAADSALPGDRFPREQLPKREPRKREHLI